MLMVAAPCGALGRWYAFGASKAADPADGFELGKIERGTMDGREEAGAARAADVDFDHLAVSPVRAQAQYRQRDT